MDDWREHITDEPGGSRKPSVKGTSVEVESVLRLLAAGWTVDRVVERLSQIKEEDVRACISYAAALLEREDLRAALKQGLDDANAGRLTPDDQVWREFEREFGPLDGDDADGM